MRLGAQYLGNGQCEFILWAPTAATVSLQLLAPNQQQIAMEQQESGYWGVVVSDVQPGTLYQYQLNDGETRPDPASNLQPQGVHGPSQVVDPQFNWSDRNWSGVPLEAMILYELHVGTFTREGTFEAAISRLPDLKDLGINAIEIMPVAQFPGDRNWGYDGVYPFAVQDSYGGPEGLKKLVDACHQQGLAVVLDVVYNHFGPEGNYLSHFGPYFTNTYRTPWGSAINFDDAYSPGVRNYFIENTLYWLRDYHIDALRLDAVHAIYDLGAKHFLQELGENVATLSEQVGRELYLIAESDLNDPRVIRSVEQGGYGLDAQWSDDFHHALHALVSSDRQGYYQDYGECEQLAKAYSDTFVYDWKYSPHRHRFHGNVVTDRPCSQFVICSQNHDQIGNRMLGERLSHMIPYEAAKLTAAAVLLSPYIPLLFMGEEYDEPAPFVYFVSHSDPDLIKAVREGRKQEFAAFHCEGEPDDPEAPETFNKCKLNWEKRHEGKNKTMLDWYKHLIQLRKTIPALTQLSRDRLSATSAETLVVLRRWSETEQIAILMNFSDQPITSQPEIPTAEWHKILDSADSKWQGSAASASDALASQQSVTLQPWNCVVYQAIA
ncbi:malto-oligosyltrehalose trehalohydrolase [Trichocoleus sp. FACHB-262]|uniref:malto-oligosyltrehalose trehalohydrolase n=1 Tax=Trichocoleus sp. FACHB-262 TaxID=2692869 RepID=UPI001683380D|nr:malto-oligosyltrehalose trehalohydrolase [Trichocoleus sp. FACHB-262]MBD2123441.1 malto-oligosyltrehalose trehalohydrolase [Trichocoleus sp. FACHB-262]